MLWAWIVQKWPLILGLLGLIGGVLFGRLQAKSADLRVAQAEADEARARQQAAEVKPARQGALRKDENPE